MMICRLIRIGWFTFGDVSALIRSHGADGTDTKAVARILGADLVVIDVIGLLALATDAAEASAG